MKKGNVGHADFFLELSEHHISAREFFSTDLLKLLERNYGLSNVLISYFDTEGNFLSWVTPQGLMVDGPEHPYRKFMVGDVIRHNIYQNAVRDRLTYFNVVPRIYKSTDMFNPIDYDYSTYVRFMEENFQAHYSVTLAFGINAYIQLSFFKALEDGDFTEDEMAQIIRIYVYIANAYKNFKKHEQSKIVSDIQSKIISSGEKAYLITDDFLHIMKCNDIAKEYLEAILGPVIEEQFSGEYTCDWLPFILSNEAQKFSTDNIITKEFQNFIFKIYTYDQTYSNKIVDRYHWITISKKTENKKSNFQNWNLPLTSTEQKVAILMCNGLTYKAIADELVVSYHTVKKHVENIYTKCGVNSRFQLKEWTAEQQK